MEGQTLTARLRQGGLDKTLETLYGGLGLEAARSRCAGVLEGFARTFGKEAEALFSAPGRTEIGGNHTDHQHGRVLAAGVDLDILAAAAANDSGPLAAPGRIEPIAQTAQHIQLLTGLHPAHDLCTPAHHFINNLEAIPVTVADGDRAAQEKAVQLYIDKLSRRGDGGGISAQGHLPDAGNKFPIACDCIHQLFHTYPSQTIFPPFMVNRHTPQSFIPAKGVARPMVKNCSGSTV